MRLIILSAVMVCMIATLPALAAKQDVRGARLGMNRQEINAALTANGFSCQPEAYKNTVDCQIREGDNDLNIIETEYNQDGVAWKIDYTFFFHTKVGQMAQFIVSNYGLQPLQQPGRYKISEDIGAAIATSGSRASFIMVNSRLQPGRSLPPPPAPLPKF